MTGPRTFDAIIVGGGPAGSACARPLVRAGMSVAVLDRETFPRMKLCAGWVTPDVFKALELDSRDYPCGLLTFDRLVIHLRGLTFTLRTVQHSIRRFEFDDFLLRRSAAPVIRHDARQIVHRSDAFEIDGTWRCRFLIGAGGTRCPVYRTIFRDRSARASGLQVVALEQEFPYSWRDPACHLWFFDNGLPGYAWYVPKADGWLNCGIGAMADRLKRRGASILDYWPDFVRRLERTGLVRGVELAPQGYGYYLRGNIGTLRIGDAFLVGDSAGLATLDLGEGIGPAVYSGIAAAAAITGQGDYSLAALPATSIDQMFGEGPWRALVRMLLEFKFSTAAPVRAAA